MYNFDLSGLFFLAIVGFGALVIAAVGGIAALIWFALYHVQIV